MSQTIEIHTKQLVEVNDLYKFLQSRTENINGVQKSETGFYFYKENESLRGVDFWKESYGYELRTTILSTDADYEVAKYIIMYCINFIADAKFYVNEVAINKQDIATVFEKNSFLADANLVKTIIAQQQDIITFYGPKGEFYLGPNDLDNIESSKEGWELRLQQLFLKVQYHLPPSESDNVMETQSDNGEEKKILKLVNRKVSYILKKYDYLIFTKDETVSSMDNMIFITNTVLNHNLPKTWELIDAYTIVAPALSNEEYDSLVNNLKAFDCREAFANQS